MASSHPPRGQSLDMALTNVRVSTDLNSHGLLPSAHGNERDVLFEAVGCGVAARPADTLLERTGPFPLQSLGDSSLLPGIPLHATPRQPPAPGPDGTFGWVNALPYTADVWQQVALTGDRPRQQGLHSRAPSADSALEIIGRSSLHSSRASHRAAAAGQGRAGRTGQTLNLHAEKEEIRMAQVLRRREIGSWTLCKVDERGSLGLMQVQVAGCLFRAPVHVACSVLGAGRDIDSSPVEAPSSHLSLHPA